MGELWRDLVDLLRTRPALWLPVLLADLLGYLLNLGRNSLLKAIVWHETSQRSALGGAVIHGPMTASAMQSATIFALLLSWFVYFVRLLLFSGALMATAALVWGYLNREPKPVQTVGPFLATRRGGIFELTLRALAVYAVAALLFSWLSSFLQKHGYIAVLRNPWFGLALGLIVLLALSILLPPVALRVLAGRTPDRKLARDSQQLAASLSVIVTVLSAFVGANSREMARIPPAARYPLEIIGSLVVALPYVLLFTGLALQARKLARSEVDTEVVA